MADQDNERIQSPGRDANAAQPLNAADDNRGAERYPSVRQDDGVEGAGEGRSFDPPKGAPAPPQGAGDGPAPASGGAVSANEGRLGPGADPAEGRR